MSTARAALTRRARRYLSIWKYNIGLDNHLGLTDINAEAEDFCCGLLNIVLDARLRNLNLLRMNFPAIDLADGEKRICVQVTSTAEAAKINHTLDRFFAHGLEKDYDRLIVLILGEKKDYRKEFSGKEGFDFDPARDVWDIPMLLNQIAALSMPQLYRLDDYLREQFYDLEGLKTPLDLPVLSALDDKSFLGRDRELEEIARRFAENERIVILSGPGGIGKSELAARFAQTRWGGESHFVHFTQKWERTVVKKIAPNIPGLNREKANAKRLYRDAMAELKKRGPDELLILDNVDQKASSLTQLKRELSELRMRILITTRVDTEQAIKVNSLRRKEMLRIFELHESAATVEEQLALIHAVEGHTLTVDLMARALRPGWRAATAEKLLRDLADSTIRKVETTYSGSLDQAKIIEHLKAVFRVAKLKSNERELLRYAALLPEGGMADELFLAPIGRDAEEELNHLIRNGWLLWQDSLLRIHPVIRAVCLEELEPSDENCSDYLEGLAGAYDENDFRPERRCQIARLLTNASRFLKGDWVGCALAAGELWRNLGDYAQALECDLRALDVLKAQLSPDHLTLAFVYNNIGCTYHYLDAHWQGLENHEKALAIRRKALPTDDPALALSYDNVGSAYCALGEYERALEFRKNALAIMEKALPSGHPALAGYYSNIGLTYDNLNDHVTALEYHQKALAIMENANTPSFSTLATCYNNISYTYSCLGDHRRDMEYQLKTLDIREKVLPSNHPNLARSCSNIAYLHNAVGDMTEAAQYMRRASDIIRCSTLPEDHPIRSEYLQRAEAYEKNAGIQRDISWAREQPKE